MNYTNADPETLEFIEIGAVAELLAGERIFIDIDGQPIVVFEISGRYFAIEDVCSHDGNPLGDGDLDGFDVVCPRHGARFDIRSGKACG